MTLDMIKKLFSVTLLFAAMTAYTSCSDKDDLDDPSVRFSAAADNCQNILLAAPNGWAMTMYGDMDFGGFNVLCKFDKGGKVTVANEMFTEKSGADTTAVTHYRLDQSSGLILSFDEYCELFHYFSDPLNTDGFRSETENGFGGDLEFRVISASADSVIMRGKKHDAKIVMTPIPTVAGETIDTVWAHYLRDVAAVTKEMQKGSYHVIVGKDTLSMKANRRNRVFTYHTTDTAGVRTTHHVPYVITPNGLTFYNTFEFSGKAVEGFKFAAGSEKYEPVGATGIVLEKFTPDLNQQLVDGAWYVHLDSLGGYAKNYLRRFRTNMINKGNCYIYYIVVGTWRNHFGLSVGPIDKDEPSGVYLSEAYFDYQYIGTDQIKMWFNGEYDEIGNGEHYADEAGFADAYFPFAGDGKKKDGVVLNPRTFKIETDNEKDPTYLRLVDQNEKKNVITLMAEQVIWPFGDKIE